MHSQRSGHDALSHAQNIEDALDLARVWHHKCLQHIELFSRHLRSQRVHEIAHLARGQWVEIQRQLNDFLEVFGANGELSVWLKGELLVLDINAAIDYFFINCQQHEDMLQVKEEFDRFEQVDDLVGFAAVKVVDKKNDSCAGFGDVVSLVLKRGAYTTQHT